MANKTIDEHAELLYSKLPAVLTKANATKDRELIRKHLLELARDQRHACAEALLDVPGDGNFKVDRDRVHAAVMNATIKH